MNIDIINTLEQQAINKLRAVNGLPPKTFATRVLHNAIVAKNPDRATVTSYKVQPNGYVRVNLNGGDSFGYYHDIDDPEKLRNFKGEPIYSIKDLDPDYYLVAKKLARAFKREAEANRKKAYVDDLKRIASDAKEQKGKLYVAFRDRKTDQFFTGVVDFETNRHDLYTVASKDRIIDFLAQHGLPRPELIEAWDYQFEPENDTFYASDLKFINRYLPSSYLTDAVKTDKVEIPTTIQRVIKHALGGDGAVFEHFINWLSVIFQYRIRTQTAWILQGTTGTGKGLLFGHIIRPLMGEEYCRSVTLPNMEDNFNKFMEYCLFLFVDEVDTDQVREMPKLVSRMKNMITEPLIPLRAMRTDLREVPNHLNIMMASNQPNSMRIEANDRRFNVCPRQEEKLLKSGEHGEDVITAILGELQDFANYLFSYPSDTALARKALDNQPKRDLQEITKTAIEEVAEAFRNGDLAYFMEHLPGVSNESVTFDGELTLPTLGYHKTMQDAISSVADGRSQLLRHINLCCISELVVGRMPHSNVKRSKLLGHHHLKVSSHTVNSKSQLNG